MDRKFETWIIGMSAAMDNAMIIGIAWVIYMMLPNINVDRLMLVLIAIAGLFPPIFYLYFRLIYVRKSFQAKLNKARKKKPGPWAARVSLFISVVVVVALGGYTYSQRGVAPALVIGVALAANQWYSRLVGSKGQ